MANGNMIDRVYAVYANQNLFNEWEEMSRRVLSLRTVIGNDMAIDHKEVLAWRDIAFEVERDLTDLRSRTLSYIIGGE